MREDLGKLILRLSIGGMLLLHGINKITHGIAMMTPTLEAKGLPTFLSYGVYIGEVLAPILVIIGLLTRIGGILIFIDMCFAIFLVHMADLGVIAQTGGWAVEEPMLYLLGGLAIFFLGAGKYSVGGRFA